jgi:cell wall-associated NlpC family hydrolase
MQVESHHNTTRGWSAKWSCLLLLLVLATGCASTVPSTPSQAVMPTHMEHAAASRPAAPENHSIEERLRAEVRTWRATPHKMGGTSRSGVDCSGFVQQVYRNLFHQSIPRTTALQVRSGQPMESAQLMPGDLVFFRPPNKIRHVGIYLGAGEFVHASTGRGVIISRLSEAYWRNCYWTARRYLAPSSASADAISNP